MKPRIWAALLAVVVLLGVTGLIISKSRPGHPAAPGSTGQKVFAVTGTIRSVDPEAGIVRIAHDEIPGYMEAMTMPFLVREPDSLKQVTSGDRVAFNLIVTDRDSWITGLQKVGESQPATAAAAAEQTRAERESERVPAGGKVPEFDLVDQDGRPIKLSDYQGKAVVISFIYTRCPLPNYCPLLSQKFAQLQTRLANEFGNRFHLVTITMDPAYDTPQVLKGYAAHYTSDFSTWSFATGSPEQIDHAARLFGLFYERRAGLIDHDLRTALIGPDGRLVHIWKSNYWTPYEVRNRIEEIMKSSSAPANLLGKARME